MHLKNNVKAISKITIIILMLISAILGGIITYMFTIYPFTAVPEKTTIIITNFHFDPADASIFKISVLNPSYSPTSANITRLALSVKGESRLYSITETDPPITNGIMVNSGETLDIICKKVQWDYGSVDWGRLAGELAGKTIIIHAFSPDSSAANIEATLPFVQLNIDARFDPAVSFRNFSLTLTNSPDSAVNLTVKEIWGFQFNMTFEPQLPQVIQNGTSVRLNCTGNWHGVASFNLFVETEEGYSFVKNVTTSQVLCSIQSVTFNEDYTDHFNVTISNGEASATYANISRIACILENGTIIEKSFAAEGILPNSSKTFKFDLNWGEYREKRINVTVFFLQDFEIDTVVTTPLPIILKVLNAEDAFKLQDTTHFNVTLQNHPSSLDDVNITKILVNETIEIINGTLAYPELPYTLHRGQTETFYCNISDWTANWIEKVERKMTLTVYAVTSNASEYRFNFTFTLPAAELKIVNVEQVEIGGTRYLNITVQNMDYSVWNLTVSKLEIFVESENQTFEQTFPRNQMILDNGQVATLFCLFDWSTYTGKNITLKVITIEGIETEPYTYNVS